jgi:hypothetical protein
MVSWAAVKRADFKLIGEPQIYQSSEHATRAFCGHCGTGLFYVNEVALPDLVDVQTATLDDPDALAPRLHVQVAERIGWMKTAHELPAFDRYPG